MTIGKLKISGCAGAAALRGIIVADPAIVADGAIVADRAPFSCGLRSQRFGPPPM
jgi:hypothetical protein